MGEAKIRLSTEEAGLINNTAVILTKNAILEKVNVLLGLLQEQQQKILSNSIAADSEYSLLALIRASSPKISKGENYQGLPYRVLDYPRYFDKANILTIRTMFWWGNFFSTTLHLAGSPKNELEDHICNSMPALREQGVLISIEDDPWQHHFEAENYVALSAIGVSGFEKEVRRKPHVKLATKIPLTEWENAIELLTEQYRKFLDIITDCYAPRR